MSNSGFKKSKHTSEDDVHHAFAKLHIFTPDHISVSQPMPTGGINTILMEECISTVRRRFIHIKRQARKAGSRNHTFVVIEEMPEMEIGRPNAELAGVAALNMPLTPPPPTPTS